jgi:hypothetical protein
LSEHRPFQPSLFANSCSSLDGRRRTKALTPYLEQILNAVSKMLGAHLALAGVSELAQVGVMSPWMRVVLLLRRCN